MFIVFFSNRLESYTNSVNMLDEEVYRLDNPKFPEFHGISRGEKSGVTKLNIPWIDTK